MSSRGLLGGSEDELDSDSECEDQRRDTLRNLAAMGIILMLVGLVVAAFALRNAKVA